MYIAGAVFWLFWLGVLDHVANMDSFDSGSFSSYSFPAPKRLPSNPFKPGNPFCNEREVKAGTDPSVLTSVSELWNAARDANITRSTQHTNINRRFAKPIKLPDDYDGRTCLRDYLRHFDRCAVINGWSSKESAAFLSAALRGEAQKILHGMSDSDLGDYSKLVARLESRFDVENQAEVFKPDFITADSRKVSHLLLTQGIWLV